MQYTISNIDELSELISSLFDVDFSLIDPISGTFLVDPVVISDGSIVNRTTHEKMVNSKALGLDQKLISKICFPSNEKSSSSRDFLFSNGLNLEELKRNLVTNDISFSISENGIITEKIQKIQETEDYPQASVFVIDVSGSMNTKVGESSNTLLDLIIYITSLNILAMKETDEVAIVTFSEEADVIQEPTLLTNKTEIIEKVKRLTAGGSTSIGLGLKEAFNLVDKFTSRKTSIHLFTDGQESRSPGRLNHYINSNIPNFDENILHLYGFSQNVDINELLSISSSSVIYYINDISVLMTSLFNGFVNSRLNKISLSVMDEYIRERTCEVLKRILRFSNEEIGIALLKEYVTELKTFEPNAFIEGLILDFQENSDSNLGQISKAIEKRYYRIWGKNYLVSYLSGLKNSVALNFKDNAHKIFITNEKNNSINYLEKLLDNYTISDFILPKVSRSGYINNHSLYNTSSGCFSGDSLILSSNGPIKISEVTENTLLMSTEGFSKPIKKTKFYYTGKIYKINEHVMLTAFHPYRKNGINYFPHEENIEISDYNGYVYDLILENKSLLKTEDEIEIATLCHNDKSDKFYHDFFSSEKPLEILNRKDDFEIEIISFERDTESQLIIGFNI